MPLIGSQGPLYVQHHFDRISMSQEETVANDRKTAMIEEIVIARFDCCSAIAVGDEASSLSNRFTPEVQDDGGLDCDNSRFSCLERLSSTM